MDDNVDKTIFANMIPEFTVGRIICFVDETSGIISVRRLEDEFGTKVIDCHNEVRHQ